MKLGQKIAEAGYYLSIPSAVANVDPNSSFKKLVQVLPMDKILTETGMYCYIVVSPGNRG